jgi:hypothetical protein
MKRAGEVSPPSNLLTGPAKPRRSVCAPAAMALSFYRRPASERRSLMSFFSWLRNRTSIRSPRGRAQHRPAAHRFRPHLEALEDRALPSTYYAATASDLIADINAANTAGGANTIVLTAPTTSPYVLTAVNNTTDGATGLPVISGGSKKVAADNLTIVGNGDTIERSTASGTPAFRLFDVAGGGTLTLQNVTLANGLAYGSGVSAEGGAIYNQGTTVLSGVTVQNNTAEGYPGLTATKKNPAPPGSDAAGGGIWSSGSLTLENSTVVQGNSALGGRSDSSGPGGNAFGGGIYVAGGTANITGTTFSFNKAQGGMGGGLGSNGGSAYGGAVYVAGGTVTLSGDTLGQPPSDTNNGFPANNTAQAGAPYPGGGGVWGNGNGGALYVAGGNATLTNDSVISNLADGWDVGLGSYTGGIFIASGATVSLDSFTVNNTHNNSTYSEGSGGVYGYAQIVGTYTLLP